jgi:citrate lyase subunit beta/citryl-CoA lyase
VFPSRLRSLLFAPAVRPDLLVKMPATGADAIVIDLEDATPPDAKDTGRQNLLRLAPQLASEVPVLARINDPSTPWYRDDLQALTDSLCGVVVPKVEQRSGLRRVTDDLANLGLNLPVVAGIETALGVADCRELLAEPTVAAAYFGAEDFIADMGGVRTASNREVEMARSQVVLAARIAGVLAIDQIVADFRDDERCRTECLNARAMGYVGKLCIHPAQVAIANQAFMPTDEEVERAKRLLAAYAQATAAGVASLAFEGQMVDEPVAAQARRVIAQAGSVAASPTDS